MAEEIDPKKLAEEIAETKKAKHMDPSLIQQVLSRELRNSKNRKEIVKNVKSKLYQVSGAYRNDNLDYSSLKEKLANVTPEMTADELKPICLEIMHTHASTRERSGILDELYGEIFRDIPQPRTICDLACGLNPFSIPWMPLEPGFRYEAFDLFSDMSDLLNCFFEKRGINGQASRANLLYGMPGGPYDLAFLFKVIPCLEQIDKFGGRHLLSQLSYSARYAAVSFPGASLSGKEKGMPRNYEVHFMNIVDQDAWEIRKVKFPTELVFILKSKVFYDENSGEVPA